MLFLHCIYCYNIYLCNSSTNKSEQDSDYQKAFYKNYKIFAVDIPDNVDFAGEKVETNRFDVRESIDQRIAD